MLPERKTFNPAYSLCEVISENTKISFQILKSWINVHMQQMEPEAYGREHLFDGKIWMKMLISRW